MFLLCGHSGNLAGLVYEEQVRDMSLLIVQGKALHCLDGIGLPTSSWSDQLASTTGGDGWPWIWMAVGGMNLELDPSGPEGLLVIKEILGSPRILAHYNHLLPLTLAADTSMYGVGGIISQTNPDSTERPIAYASCTLTESEKNYVQLKKEALALVLKSNPFHQFLYGQKFTSLMDHKPLTAILGQYNSIPPSQLQACKGGALILSVYTYEICFQHTEKHANADCLSRLSLNSSPGPERSVEATCFNLGQVHTLSVTADRLSRCSRQDPLVSCVMHFICNGWPATVATELKPYHTRHQELTLEGQCLLWEIRVVVPRKLQQRLVEVFHCGHGGMVKMKSLTPSAMWWPRIDADIEALAKACTSCKAVTSVPSQAPLHLWWWHEFPWQQVHMNFAGPFCGNMFMLLMNAHFKWPEILEMTSTMAGNIIATLRRLFSAFGLPGQLIKDYSHQLCLMNLLISWRAME